MQHIGVDQCRRVNTGQLDNGIGRSIPRIIVTMIDKDVSITTNHAGNREIVIIHADLDQSNQIIKASGGANIIELPWVMLICRRQAAEIKHVATDTSREVDNLVHRSKGRFAHN